MHLLNSIGELKLKYSFVKNEATLLQDIHFALQNHRVIAMIEEITGIKNQFPDKSPLAGAISTYLKGHYINPHIDNSHDGKKTLSNSQFTLLCVSGLEIGKWREL